MISVLVYAANPIVRAGLESIIRSSEGLEVVGTSSDTGTLDEMLEVRQPDVVLLDMPNEDDRILGILSNGNRLDIPALVVLADNSDSDWVADALRSGVRAILPRAAKFEEIRSTIEAAAIGLVVLYPDLVDFLLPVKESPARSPPISSLQALTPREIEVLAMLAEGHGNKTIARRLNISEHTVKFHVSSIFTKLNARSRTEAVTLGARLGLVML